MIRANLPGPPATLVLAPVRGLASEVLPVLDALRDFGPGRVGLGLSEGELASLRDYFVFADAEPVVPLTSNETSEVRGLVRFGEVRVPNPSFVEVLRWADAVHMPAEPLDPNDDRTAELFAEHIGYVELVRRTVRERRVARSPPAPSSADEYALLWDRSIAAGKGSRDYADARDRYLAQRVRALAADGHRVAVVVDRERFDSVRSLLSPEPSPTIA